MKNNKNEYISWKNPLLSLTRAGKNDAYECDAVKGLSLAPVIHNTRLRSKSESRLPSRGVTATLNAPYCLDKTKALKNQLKAAERPSCLVTEKTGGGIRITLQAGLYEIVKAGIQP